MIVTGIFVLLLLAFNYTTSIMNRTRYLYPLKKIGYLILLIGCTFQFSFLIAQDKKTDTAKKVSYFKFSGSYLNNALYNGRKDSLLTPYINPSVGYFDKSGFYISGSISYLATSAASRIDLFAFDAGYDFDFTDKFSGTVYANKSFYNKASTAVKSDIKGSIGGSLSYDFDLLQLSAGSDITFSQKTDIAFNFVLAHAFYFGEEHKVFSITPSVSTNMSTLNFYEGYTNRKVGKKANQANPNAASVTATTVVNNNKLTLLDYEVSAPFTYDAEKFGIFFTPTIAIPQNPIYTTTTTTIKLRNGTQSSVTQDSTLQSEKKIENTFFFELGVYFKF